MWALPEPHYTPKRNHLNGIGSITGEKIPWALADPTRVIERLAEIKPENRT